MKKKEDTSLKEKVSSIASESNVHGISRIVSDRPKYLRFLWLFAFLGLLSFGVYQVTSIILNFHQYPTKTNFKVGFDPLPFPAITICNMNKIKKSKMNTINSSKLEDILNGNYDPNSHKYDGQSQSTNLVTVASSTVASFQESETNASSTSSSNTTNTTDTLTQASTYASTTAMNQSEYQYDLDDSYYYFNKIDTGFYGDVHKVPVIVSKDYTIMEQFTEEYQKLSRGHRIQVGHHLEDMLLDCTFAGTNCDRVFKSTVTLDFGNCYTFQSSRYIASTSGPLGGLTLTINLENHEAFEAVTESFGLRLVIHEVGSFPLPNEKGTTISGGLETSLGLKMTRIKRLGTPYGKCQDPLEYFRKHSIRYSIQMCLKICLEDMVSERCGCFPGILEEEENLFTNRSAAFHSASTENPTNFGETNGEEPTVSSGCFTTAEKACYKERRRYFWQKTEDVCNCPPPCFENIYSTSYSGATWPHRTKLDELRNLTCEKYDKKGFKLNGTCALDDVDDYMSLSSNFLKVHIFFAALNYEEVIEEPLYDVNQLIADVGGSLGLCIGFSLLCVFELLEVFLEFCRVLKRKVLHSNHVQAINNAM